MANCPALTSPLPGLSKSALPSPSPNSFGVRVKASRIKMCTMSAVFGRCHRCSFTHPHSLRGASTFDQGAGEEDQLGFQTCALSRPRRSHEQCFSRRITPKLVHQFLWSCSQLGRSQLQDAAGPGTSDIPFLPRCRKALGRMQGPLMVAQGHMRNEYGCSAARRTSRARASSSGGEERSVSTCPCSP